MAGEHGDGGEVVADSSGGGDGPEGSEVLSAAGLRRWLVLRRRDSAKTIFQKPELAAFAAQTADF